MPIVARCTKCQASLRLADSEAYKRVECTWCGQPVLVGPPGSTPEILAALARKRQAEAEAPPPAESEPNQTEEKAIRGPLLPPANWFALAALLTGSFGLMSASWSGLQSLAVPLSLLALVLGVAAVAVPSARRRSRVGIAVAAAAIGLLATANAYYAVIWPWLVLRRAAQFPVPQASDLPRPLRLPPPGELPPLVQPPALPQGEWTDASLNAVQKGDIRVRVLGVRLGRVPLAGSSNPEPSADTKLSIQLRINNVGTRRKIDYLSWGDAERTPTGPLAVLTDSRERTYKPVSPAKGARALGSRPAAALPPGKYVEDFLVFDAPPDEVEYFRLELPAAAFGDAGSLKLHIPWTLVKKGGDA